MYKPCTFNREDYLELSSSFEAVAITDAQNELTEFSDDAEDLAFELAYTRYALAKAEKQNETGLNIIHSYGGIDGGHHKQWVIDQAVRSLTGDKYNDWVKKQKDGEDGPDTYDWWEGIAP